MLFASIDLARFACCAPVPASAAASVTVAFSRSAASRTRARRASKIAPPSVAASRFMQLVSHAHAVKQSSGQSRARIDSSVISGSIASEMSAASSAASCGCASKYAVGDRVGSIASSAAASEASSHFPHSLSTARPLAGWASAIGARLRYTTCARDHLRR